jgi:hypothetical protein
MEYAYHYSDTVRLPWILHSGELRPTYNPSGRDWTIKYPSLDFLWASTSDQGCPTAALVNKKELYKAGVIHKVRFTLASEDFSNWPDLAVTHPDWSAIHIATLNKTGAELGDDPRTWRCRIDALDKSHWVAVHLRTYRNSRWVELPTETVVHESADIRVVDIPGIGTFASRQFKNESGTTAYQIKR